MIIIYYLKKYYVYKLDSISRLLSICLAGYVNSSGAG